MEIVLGFLGLILYIHSVVGGGVQMYKRHIWREDTQCRPATDAYTRIYNYVNIYTPSVASGTQLTSTTHFSCLSKRLRTSLYKTYHRVFDFIKSKSTG